MRNFRFLALVVILPLVIAAPPMRVSATRSASRPSNYAPGEVIVKLKAAAPQLRSDGKDEKLMTIARLAGAMLCSSGFVVARTPYLVTNRKVGVRCHPPRTTAMRARPARLAVRAGGPPR